MTQHICATHTVCANTSHTDRCPNCFLEVTLLCINFTDRCALFASEILCKHQQHLQGSSMCCAPGFTGKSKSPQLFGDFMVCLRPFEGKASPALGPSDGNPGIWTQLTWIKDAGHKTVVNSSSWAWRTCFVCLQLVFSAFCEQRWWIEWQRKTQSLKDGECLTSANGRDQDSKRRLTPTSTV